MAKGTTAIKTRSSETAGAKSLPSASTLIDARIVVLGDWRGKTLARMRALIHEACPEVEETWKWRGVPVFEKDGILCTGETYKAVVKLTFANGAKLADPKRLFNASLEGNARRAIDIREGEMVDAVAFKALIQAAVAANAGKAKAAKPAARPKKPVKLLSGGNPQIAKGEGDAPVQDYIAALSGWQRDLARRLDALVVKSVPDVKKAVKWNSPFYGIEGQGWFLAVHVFTRYLKVTFFKGTSLKPVPPGGTSKEARWIDIHEGETIDDAQMARWVKQAAAVKGWGK